MVVELGQGIHLRHAEAGDHDDLCLVCLKTGNAGEDATQIEDEPDLVGMVYAVPFQVLEPEFCFVVRDQEGTCGYVMGTPDTISFDRRAASEWFPKLQARVALPPFDASQWQGSDWVRDKIHRPTHIFPESLRPFPAQGHIDLLPRARGKGAGKAAMKFLMHKLHAAGAAGIHLHVAPGNGKAQAFYRALGFGHLVDPILPDHTAFMTRALP